MGVFYALKKDYSIWCLARFQSGMCCGVGTVVVALWRFGGVECLGGYLFHLDLLCSMSEIGFMVFNLWATAN